MTACLPEIKINLRRCRDWQGFRYCCYYELYSIHRLHSWRTLCFPSFYQCWLSRYTDEFTWEFFTWAIVLLKVTALLTAVVLTIEKKFTWQQNLKLISLGWDVGWCWFGEKLERKSMWQDRDVIIKLNCEWAGGLVGENCKVTGIEGLLVLKQ